MHGVRQLKACPTTACCVAATAHLVSTDARHSHIEPEGQLAAQLTSPPDSRRKAGLLGPGVASACSRSELPRRPCACISTTLLMQLPCTSVPYL